MRCAFCALLELQQVWRLQNCCSYSAASTTTSSSAYLALLLLLLVVYYDCCCCCSWPWYKLHSWAGSIIACNYAPHNHNGKSLQNSPSQASNSAGNAATGAKSEVEDSERQREREVGCRLTGEWVGQLDSVSSFSILRESEREREEGSWTTMQQPQLQFSFSPCFSFFSCCLPLVCCTILSNFV